jgi:ribulose-phosphate 3-epimerase
LLAANFGRLDRDLAGERRGGLAALDIMDGISFEHFGPEVVRVLRPVTNVLDVHLMCSRPEVLLERFAQAGADRMTVHVELGEKVDALLWKIKSLGTKVGLAINPPTTIGMVQPFLGQIDLLLIMTVNPGFGGQPFIVETLPKIQQAQAWRREKNLDYRIEVDGGINFTTAAECARAGADTFVSGTGLFGQRSLKVAIKKMRKVVNSTRPEKLTDRVSTAFQL